MNSTEQQQSSYFMMSHNASCDDRVMSEAMERRESSGSFDCIGMNTVSYSRMKRENQMVAYNVSNSSRLLKCLNRWDRPWTRTNFPPPPPSRFSNKIVLVVDFKNREIVHMNDCAARILFGCEQFPRRPLIDALFSGKHKKWLENAIKACEQAVGAVIVATSDLVDICDSSGTNHLVSAFVQKLTRTAGRRRCLALFVFERCYRLVAHCVIDRDGLFLEYDQNMMALAGGDLKDRKLEDIVNCVQAKELVDMDTGSQMYVTGRNKRHHRFPMTISMVGHDSEESAAPSTLSCRCSLELHVYTTIGGLVIIDRPGCIVDANAAFLRIFLGYENNENLFGEPVTRIIPDFYGMNRCSSRYGPLLDLESPSPNSSSDINDSISAARLTTSLAKDLSTTRLHSPPFKRRRKASGDGPGTAATPNLAREVILREAARTSTTPPVSGGKTSTPAKNEHVPHPSNGHYFCHCLHRDGSHLEAQCHLSQVESDRWALWLCRSFQDPHTIELYLESAPADICLEGSKLQVDDPVAEATGYFAKYDNIVELQSGRLGPIFVAKRKSKLLEDRYVVKFATKTEMKTFDVIENDRGQLMPREAYVLASLNHKNVIKLVDFMEDEYFYQIVLERHGVLCDLINFTALNPDVDEQLCAYIFEQVVSAVDYLHSNDVVHLNIRAENIVIDQHFATKLIDFSFAHKGDTDDLPFVGGLDYCPPEVLLGLKCEGKPVDVWSMGVSLFLLMFGFLPFKEPYAIIRSIRLLPNMTSEPMAELFCDLFCPFPQTRITCEQLMEHAWVKQEVNIDMYRWEDVVKRGDLQTHIEYQALQHNSGKASSSPSPGAYPGLSPIMNRRRIDPENGTCSILNKTIDVESDEEEGGEGSKQAKRTLSTLLRSLSNIAAESTHESGEEQGATATNSDVSFGSADGGAHDKSGNNEGGPTASGGETTTSTK